MKTGTTLLDTSSALYLKRLVRALNALPDGFYANTPEGRLRFVRARWVTPHGFQGRTLAEWGTPSWLPLSGDLTDAYGRTVSASRTP